MLKEIHEQPSVIARIISSHIVSADRIKLKLPVIGDDYLKGVENIMIIACGTAYHAGLIGKYAMESFIKIPVWVDLGSEFRYRSPIVQSKTLVIAISQSGETADTLAAVEEAKKNKIKVLSICNVPGSALTRISDDTLYTHARPEISVASTKAFTSQVMMIYLVGLYLARL